MNDLAERFNYHPATTAERRDAHEEVRNTCLALAIDIDRFVPEGRERALAITKIEEAMFWANAGIARQPAEPSLQVGTRVCLVKDGGDPPLGDEYEGRRGTVVRVDPPTGKYVLTVEVDERNYSVPCRLTEVEVIG